MTRTEALEVLAYLSARYPSQGKMTAASIEAYVSDLADFPAELARNAAKTLVQNSEFFPSVAAVVREIVDQEIDLPTPEAAWNQILRRNSEDDWEGLDRTIRTALRAAGGTHALAHDETHFVRRAFLDSYTALRKDVADTARTVSLPALERGRLASLTRHMAALSAALRGTT